MIVGIYTVGMRARTLNVPSDSGGPAPHAMSSPGSVWRASCAIGESMEINWEHKLILAIQRKLDRQNWTPETLEEIADLLRAYGFDVRDVED